MENQAKVRLLVLWLAAFGLPFVLITDLFPLHRFGMFARLPDQKSTTSKCYLETKTGTSDWLILKTGNAYFDEGYLSKLGSEAIDDPSMAKNLAEKLKKTLYPVPDSLRMVAVRMTGITYTKPIYLKK